MTNPEFCNLQNLIIQGNLTERRDLIDSMTFAQLIQFTQRLTLPANYPSLNEATWKYIAVVLAILAEAYQWKVDGPGNPCSDPFNPDCECVTGEHEAAEITDEFRAAADIEEAVGI